ncbi:MAG: arsenate reductase (glutaredoxin) [Gammaproteobacteria bacterium]|nr:arsenate reductase (glutaredoxin) [Gammaproteobacteria bacterium]
MTVKIYHNPRCSKSRQTLQILVESGAEHEVVLYLQEPPAAGSILRIAEYLQTPVASLLRSGESAVKDATDLPDLNNDEALAAWLHENPIAIERPIVVDSETGKAVIGRPPENVRELLGK